MSGQIVGEVIAASDALRACGLSERGFYALIAIAEKAHSQTRQASVRWDHVTAGLYGASKRTAERAVRDLKQLGVLVVLRPGFDNGHGRSAAPIYEIRSLTDADTWMSASAGSDTDIQVSASTGTDTDRTTTDTDKSGDRYRQNGDRYRHPDVILDGSIDGPIDGSNDGLARAGARARHVASTRTPIGGSLDIIAEVFDAASAKRLEGSRLKRDQDPPPPDPPESRSPRCANHRHSPAEPGSDLCAWCQKIEGKAPSTDQPKQAAPQSEGSDLKSHQAEPAISAITRRSRRFVIEYLSANGDEQGWVPFGQLRKASSSNGFTASGLQEVRKQSSDIETVGHGLASRWRLSRSESAAS